MKDAKSLAWLLPAAGLLILFGWLLGRLGWNFSRVNVGVGELEPPTATSASQAIQPLTTPLPLTTVSSSVQNRPASIHLKTGQTAILPDDWMWICIGDFSITAPDGRTFNYYDIGGVTTGLIIVLEANTRGRLGGPEDVPRGVDIGDCHPILPSEKTEKLNWAINLQLRQGCTGSGCGSVRVVEIDRNYNVTSDYWK